MRNLVVVAAVIGCGRLGFEAHIISDGATDAGIDGPPPARVQVLAPGYGSVASLMITVNETAGDLIVAAVYWDQTPDTVTLSDTAGLAWASRPALVVPGCGGTTGNATGAQLYFAQVAATGANTVTVAQTSGTQPLGLALLEYANVTATVDAFSAVMAPASSNAMQATAITTSGPGVVIGFFNDTIGTGSDGGGSAYTVQARDTGFPNIIEDALVPAGTYAPDATLPPGAMDACWVASAIAFRGR